VKSGVLLTALLAFALAGCAAANKGGPYAGIDRHDVGGAARDIIDQETSDQTSRLYGKELTVADTAKGADPTTRRPAWVVSMENFDHVRSRACLYLWGRFTPFQGSTVNYDVDDCPSGGA
jgi:hypothetical protein